MPSIAFIRHSRHLQSTTDGQNKHLAFVITLSGKRFLWSSAMPDIPVPIKDHLRAYSLAQHEHVAVRRLQERKTMDASTQIRTPVSDDDGRLKKVAVLVDGGMGLRDAMAASGKLPARKHRLLMRLVAWRA